VNVAKQRKRLDLRRKAHDRRHTSEPGFKRPGSMNRKKSFPVPKPR
jgi:hypothetical protein